MVKLFRDSVTLSDIWVSSNGKLSDFYASSWQRGDSALPLLVLRLLLAAAAVGILAWSVAEGASPYWLIYLTNWGLLMVTMMTLSGLLVSGIIFVKKPSETSDSDIPWYISMYWLLYNSAVSLAIMITALYWILLYDSELSAESPRMFWLDLSTHGFNSCIAFLEVALSRTPVRFLNFYQPLGIGLWYAAFTAIYYAAGGTDAMGNHYIYEILDWKYGKRAGGIVGISIAGLLAIYALLWALALCRDKASTSLVRTTSQALQATPPDDILHTRIV
ncbi:protein rolling stone-like [Ostrinia nubilalis]|uniref:protein rolling stone-like n=1 Tax=Ostrinia nubilalis TaxID=29057 RepID=UPI0030824D57